MTAPPRTAALNALRAVDERRDDLPAALARSRTRLTDPRDRALTTEIVTGTLRWQRLLDHLIAAVAARPLSRIDPAVLLVLRLSVYQLLHLDRVPASAVVDDAVDLTRTVRRPHATGFVNAILRTILRGRGRLPIPPRPESPDDRDAALAYLGIACSHPEWLVARWLDRHGFDATEAWVRFDNTAPPVCLWANRLQGSREALAATLRERAVATEPTVWAPDGLLVRSGLPFGAAAEGAFLAQDEASQLVGLIMEVRPGDRVLDLCAAPGGKATAMAANMCNSGLLVASDVRPRRLALLRQTLTRAGVTCARTVRVAVDGPLPFAAARFDRVLVDAPCSGLGTIRRDPDIRWRRTETELPALAAAQRALVTRAADAVALGGRLVYATCSSEPEENEQVLHAFLADRPTFAPLDLRDTLPPALEPLVDEDGALRTLPFAHGLEAFFAAALVRRA